MPTDEWVPPTCGDLTVTHHYEEGDEYDEDEDAYFDVTYDGWTVVWRDHSEGESYDYYFDGRDFPSGGRKAVVRRAIADIIASRTRRLARRTRNIA